MAVQGIITEQEAMTFLKIVKADNASRKIIRLLVPGVSRAINSYCNRTFKQTTYSNELYDGNGLRELILNNAPIISVTSVTRIDTDADLTETVIGSAEYLIKKPEGFLLMHISNYDDSSIWVRGDQNYKITYIAGFAAADVPEDVKLACKYWIANFFDTIDKNLFKKSSVDLAETTTNYLNEPIPKSVKQLLDYWKILK